MIAAITILIALLGAVLLLMLFVRIRDAGKELRLDKHRSKAMGFADLLVYAAVVEDALNMTEDAQSAIAETNSGFVGQRATIPA